MSECCGLLLFLSLRSLILLFAQTHTHRHNAQPSTLSRMVNSCGTHSNDFTHSDSFSLGSYTMCVRCAVMLLLLVVFLMCCRRRCCCYFFISFLFFSWSVCYASFSDLTDLHEKRERKNNTVAPEEMWFLFICVLCVVFFGMYVQGKYAFCCLRSDNFVFFGYFLSSTPLNFGKFDFFLLHKSPTESFLFSIHIFLFNGRGLGKSPINYCWCCFCGNAFVISMVDAPFALRFIAHTQTKKENRVEFFTPNTSNEDSTNQQQRSNT